MAFSIPEPCHCRKGIRLNSKRGGQPGQDDGINPVVPEEEDKQPTQQEGGNDRLRRRVSVIAEATQPVSDGVHQELHRRRVALNPGRRKGSPR